MFMSRSPARTPGGKATNWSQAARKYDRIVMHGTQGRSAEGYLEGVRKLREGVIGEVYLSRGLCFKWRDTIGKAPVEPVPAGVDYDLWTGPAPLKPFTRNRFHYNWHWIWDTGNGDWAIKACMKWIWRAGRWASSSPTKFPPSAATSCSKTIRKHPTS